MKVIETPDDVNLSVLGDRLARIDRSIVQMIASRMAVVRLVGEFKSRHNQPIVRLDIEQERIEAIGKFAQEQKLDPTFIKGIIHGLINESCKRQLVQLEAHAKDNNHHIVGEEERYTILKMNLLELAENWSETYDEYYDRPYFATHAYLEFEAKLLAELVSRVADKALFVDLGCATGRCLYGHHQSFENCVGYDLSNHMIEKARAKLNESIGSISFKQHDLDDGIPIEDATASVIVMSMGTASDVRNIKALIGEIARVLKVGGRFLLSFYNAEALLYSSFFPWETGLAAQIDIHKHCLTVHKGSDVFEVYAHAYQPEETRLLFAPHPTIQIDQVSTYPTLGAVLPKDLLEESAVQKEIISLDQALSNGTAGAYILVTGLKR